MTRTRPAYEPIPLVYVCELREYIEAVAALSVGSSTRRQGSKGKCVY
jgi:hypothetical protein